MTPTLGPGSRLSPQQLRAWRLERDEGIACANRSALCLEGRLDRGAWRRALGAVVARHDVLRTAFRLAAGASAPLAFVLPPGTLTLPEIDLSALGPGPRAAGLARLLGSLAGLRLDLENGRVWRAVLVRLGECDHRLWLALAAACADPGSLAPLAADLLAAYEVQLGGRRQGLPPALQYAEVAAWQNGLLEGADTAEAVELWRQHWRGHDLDAEIALPPPLSEPAAVAGPLLAEAVDVPLDREAAGSLARLAAAWDCPLPALALTGWIAVLARATGRDQVLAGVLHTGRDLAELQGVVGPLARYLPVVARCRPQDPPRHAVDEVREALTEAERRGEYFSWDQASGHAAGGFPVCFEAATEPWRLAAGGLAVTPAPAAWNGSLLDRFCLALSCRGTGDELRLAVRYDRRRLRPEAAHRLAGRLSALLGSLAGRPAASLADHPAMAPEEMERWLALCRSSPPAADPSWEHGTLHRELEAQADRAPDRVAVVAGSCWLTFGELDARSNRLARHLRAAGAGPEVPVALCLERQVEAVVAMLAAWKAGAAHVPLDVAQPVERLTRCLADARTPLLVTLSRLAAALPGGGDLPGVRMVRLDADAAAIAARSAARLAGDPGPRGLAYVIYTSGSTGRPKGVQVEHRSALHLLAALAAALGPPAAQAARGRGPLRASLNAPLYFDVSIGQLLLLLRGHTLHMVPQEVRADGTALLRFLRERDIDLLDGTPAQLRLLVEAGLLDGAAGPRLLWSAGEAVDGPLWQRLGEAAPTVSYNLYGPTEGTVYATWHRIEPGSTRPTIGRPLPGYEAFLLDGDQRPVPPGAPGEICLGGAGLARGYLGDPGLTAERFVPHPHATRPGERLYRTGDLARHLLDGNVEFLGRRDRQVKIRGFRVELGEIEAALLAVPGVRQAAVMAWEAAPGDRRLVAYVAGAAAAATAAALREALRERLPDPMQPAAYVLLPALPLTRNGKVDRKALPAPDWQAPAEGYQAPRTPVEELVAGIWAEQLGAARVGRGDDFFELGGHSLVAARVIARLRGACRVEMPLRTLFKAPTVAALAERIEELRRAGGGPVAPPLAPVPRQGPLPLSFAQQRLWFLHQLDPLSPAYNMPFAFRLDGPLDRTALATSLTEVVRRHETLRTTLTVVDGVPRQSIAPPVPQPLPVVDLSALPEPREAVALRLGREEAMRPFDLLRPPVVRTRLLRLGEREHVLLFTMHHVSGDGWSVEVLSRELAELYGAAAEGRPSRLAALPVQYADFAVWQRSWLTDEILDAQLAYWRRQLAGAPPLLAMPLDQPRPPRPSFRGRRRRRLLPAGLVGPLWKLGRSRQATGFMTVLGGFQALLHRYSSQDSVVVGTPIANRDRAELEPMIGFFANVLALRADLAADPGFAALLAQVRDTALAAYDQRDLPFERLVDEVAPQRDLSYPPVFQALLVYQNAAQELPGLRGLSLRVLGTDEGIARFDLTLLATETAAGLEVQLDFNADLFAAATGERLLRLLHHLLSRMAAEPDRPIGALPLLDDEEHRQVVLACNATACARADGELDLHGLVARHAAGQPDAPALVADDGVISYGELAAWAGRIAARLQELGIGTEDRVGICLERSAGAIAAMLGILRAGAAYVPLDPESPRARLAAVAADAGLAAVLTRDGLAAGPALAAHELRVDEAGPERPADPPPWPATPEAAAYVIYTSGSTGAAKGVVVSHRGAANFVHGIAGALALGPADRLLLFAPLFFDASVLQIFAALGSGAALVIHRNPRELAARDILALCERHGATVLDLPAALWRQWVDEVAAARLPLPATLRAFLTGGERVPAARLHTWAALVGREVSFLSSYGPTEASVTATVWQTTTSGAAALAAEHVPIGRPLPNVRAYVLDRQLRPVPCGVTGELLLGGWGLARGYLGRPDLSAEAFVPDALSGEPGARLYRTGDLGRRRADGDLEFLGRVDHQLKLRGFRIEPAEIEAALARCAAVRQAVVTLREDVPGDARLVAYVLAHDGRRAEAAELRAFLAEHLPSHMLPTDFVALDELPVLPSGKLDRAALPAPPRAARSTAFVAPRDALEQVLAEIWSEVLGVEQVGAGDDFFALGGHSLTATRALARIRQALDIDFQLRGLFEEPTVAGLAEALRRSDDGPKVQRMAALRVELAALSDEEVEARLLAEAAAEQGARA